MFEPEWDDETYDIDRPCILEHRIPAPELPEYNGEKDDEDFEYDDRGP